MVGVLASYRLADFEQNEMCIVTPDWEKVNNNLYKRKWVGLNDGNARFTAITENNTVIDIRELEINGAVLDMKTAIKRMQHDLIDDWFFDPLHYSEYVQYRICVELFFKKRSLSQLQSTKDGGILSTEKIFCVAKGNGWNIYGPISIYGCCKSIKWTHRQSFILPCLFSPL